MIMDKQQEPKINLAIMLLLLTKIDNGEAPRGRLDTITDEQILDIYRSQDYANRNAYYDAIRVKVISLKNKTETFMEAERVRREAIERERMEALRQSPEKKIKVMNETHQTIYLYWCFMREGASDWTICKCFGPIPAGHDFNIKYKKDNTHIITTRSDRGNECYYMDIKEKKSI